MTEPDVVSRPPVRAVPTVAEELRELADAAERAVEKAELSRPLRKSADALLSKVRRGRDYGEALRAVDAVAAEVARLATAVAEFRGDLGRRQQARSLVEPFGQDWKEMVAAEIARMGDQATPQWVRRYAEAFAAGRFDVCVWLCGGAEKSRAGPPGTGTAAGAGAPGAAAGPTLADRDLARRLLLAARAARSGDLAAALPGLETLTESAHAAALPQELSARVWCMRVRAVARGQGDPARGRDAAWAALERGEAPGSGVPAPVLAALHAAHGECLLGTGDRAGATLAANRSHALAPSEPAGSVLQGLVAEAAGDLATADKAYERAAAAGASRAASGELFAPTPPNLLWQCGRLLRGTDPRQAVRVIREALRGGVSGSGRYPERKAYFDLARALERRREGATGALKQRLDAEAAEAYWEAGRRYAWVGDEPSAINFLSRACDLEPANAGYAFELAEVLRIRAVHEDGTVDLAMLEEAADRWREAYALGIPGADLPWAYLTMALVEHERSGDLYRPRASSAAVALLERGLLCAPGDVRTMAQLSGAHRLLGARHTAVGLAETASRLNSDDELAFDQRLLALLELERWEEALELVEAHGLRPDQPWLVIRRVQLLLTLRRPAEALKLLQTARPVDQALNGLYLGLCHELQGDAEPARQAYEQVAAGAGSAGPEGRADLSAWACYLLGRYDEAEHAFQELIHHDPDDASLRRNLGQVLLARGDETRGDPRVGRDHLAAGIAATQSIWALRTLELVGLPRLVERAGAGSAARAAIDEIAAVLRNREQALCRPPGPEAELKALLETMEAGSAARDGMLLALARLELESGAVDAALERYVELVREVPEAGLGVRAAAEQLRRSADELADRGEPASALAVHRQLLELLARSPEPPVAVASASHVRAAFAALELGQEADFERHVLQAFPAGLPVESEPAVKEALTAAFAPPELYWAVTDAARRIDHEPDSAAARLLAALDPSALLRASREEVGSGSLFPLATPLALRLGPGLLNPDHGGPTPRQLVEQVRRRVEEDTGVPVPGIALQPLPDGADLGTYVVELFEDEVARGQVPPGSHFVPADSDGPPPAAPASAVDWIAGTAGRWTTVAGDEPSDGSWSAEEFVVRHLEAVIRAHLPRLFSIDDVGIWLSSIQGGTDAGTDIDRLSLADRLELLRLLRLLLREQVPIVEAAAIVRMVQEAGPVWSALDLLPAVRARLRSQLVPAAIRAIPPVLLPAELEEAFASGCSPEDTYRWQLPRAEAVDLAERVARWYADRPQGSVVVVRDARLRPYFWRLLAGLVPGPVWVLAKGESDVVD
jgi:tetratricopeptide (TPR) repeat protein